MGYGHRYWLLTISIYLIYDVDIVLIWVGIMNVNQYHKTSISFNLNIIKPQYVLTSVLLISPIPGPFVIIGRL